MPAMLDDPTAPVIHRTSGDMPFLVPGGLLPFGVAPRKVTLRDRITIATIIPFSAPSQVPFSLMTYLCDQLSREIEKGDTYPMIDPLPLEVFGPYWFGVFGAIMLLGDISGGEEMHEMSRDWERECLGSFYIKPNYPGRSSHVCNGGFLVTDASRNRGVGRLMGETYLEWAPKLGYTYSVFNLVYETNVASCRIWDALGFKRIGRVKGCGSLASHPDELIDAIIYGRDLGQDDDFVLEERFDKIRFYLKNGKYPNGADRAEKSRLRSAATHYRLIPASDESPEKLMLKGKEVISDPQRQYEIAREIHHRCHGGINKTTATIAESYHWVRIKDSVSQVIRNCTECSEMNKGLSIMRSQQRRYAPDNHPNDPSPAHLQQPQLGQTQPQGYLSRQLNRSDSPGSQLQMEASRHSNDLSGPFVQSNSQYMSMGLGVDPSLMEGVQPTNLEDLPPSPFLAAARGLPHRPEEGHLPDLDLSASVLQQSHSAGMNVMGGPVPNIRDELRRRLSRAGYPAE